MKLNTHSALMDVTHEGAPIKRITPLNELRRFTATALMWEDTFYESGQDNAKRVKELIPQIEAQSVADLAIYAREQMYLRHVPLFLMRELARRKGTGPLVAQTLERVIQRADELAEFVVMYWRDKREPLSSGVKRGLAAAFRKFSTYQLAKYNRDGAVKLRDVLFLTHAKPKDDEQAAVWKRLVDGTLESPDTWEVALSAGADKKATWERLLREKQLGGLAALRNLRNMITAGVDDVLIRARLADGAPRTLPWQYLAAAKHAPRFEPEIEMAMLKSLETTQSLSGTTAILIDVSGSMDDPMSGKSEMTRMDAAAGVAILLCEKLSSPVHIGTFSIHYAEIPARRGFALRDAIIGSQPHSGTYLQRAMEAQRSAVGMVERLVVVTDGQSADGVSVPYGQKNYMLNIAPHRNGVGYDQNWTLINGFSDRVVDFIVESERLDAMPSEPLRLD